MVRVRLGTEHVGGSGYVYYPPETARWRIAGLAIALTLGVGGSFALGQALGHHMPSSVAARHPTVMRSAGRATGALSTASAPTPTPHPALPSAAPAQPLSATPHGNEHTSDGQDHSSHQGDGGGGQQQDHGVGGKHGGGGGGGN